MSKMNWSNCKKPAASYGTKRQLALKLEQRDKIKATEKQINYMKKLGIDHPAQVTKRQAMHLISSFIDKCKATESAMRGEWQRAMDNDNG